MTDNKQEEPRPSSQAEEGGFVQENGSPIKSPILGIGRFGLVTASPNSTNHVLKIPKIYRILSTDDVETTKTYQRLREENIAFLEREKRIYRRLNEPNRHPGILECESVSSAGIELVYQKRGDLETFIDTHSDPGVALKAHWVVEVASAIAFAHAKDIWLDDVALRNILVADTDHLSVQLFDFGNAVILSEEEDGKLLEKLDFQADIFYFGCIAYSILAWECFYVSLDDWNEDSAPVKMRWPAADDMPATDALPFGNLIEMCWTKDGFRDMEEVHGAFAERMKLVTPVEI